MENEEIWKDIKGYEGYYQISNFGNIKSVHRNKLLKGIDNHGYYRVNLYKDNVPKLYRIHRLVAENFLDNLENKPEVNHKDGNKTNNTVNNLEWCTRQENQIHAYKTGLQTGKRVIQYDKYFNVVNIFDNLRQASLSTGIMHLSECCNGKRKSSGGYYWKFAEDTSKANNFNKKCLF